MKRCDLIRLISLIALAWPIQTLAQPPVGTRHVGVLMYLEKNDPQSNIYL
jgi:hypothetical protein